MCAHSDPQYPQADEISWEQCQEMFSQLLSAPPSKQEKILETLLSVPLPGVREQALRSGMMVLTDEQLVSYLRDEADDILRNSALEILKKKGRRSFPLALQLLHDEDADVVLQAVLTLDHIRDPRALTPLVHLLFHRDANIVQATIIALGHLGDDRIVNDLLPFLQRDPWLQAATIEALGNLRSRKAGRALKALLPDLFVGPLAAEALARIGGLGALRALVEHWIQYHEQVEPESLLGYLAYVLEGLKKKPVINDDFKESLLPYIEIPTSQIRSHVARCLLILGPGDYDDEALDILAADPANGYSLPACLYRRPDLIPRLLPQHGILQIWGFHLAARFPRETPVLVLSKALKKPELPDPLEVVVPVLLKIRQPELAGTILSFYCSLPSAQRPLLHPVVQKQRTLLRTVFARSLHFDPETRIVLAVLLKMPIKNILKDILDLDDQSRIRVIYQLGNSPALIRKLPWLEWLQENPELYGEVAAQIVVQLKLTELLEPLRLVLQSYPSTALVKALGELADKESVPTLISLFHSSSALLRGQILESLGFIGGPEVRQTLINAALQLEPAESRIAYRALSKCAIADDSAFFRKACTNSDWYVRLACVDVFGRFPSTANMNALAQLVNDHVSIVAQQAKNILE